jgi:Adenosine deaminase
MVKNRRLLTERRWRGISENDSSYDGSFFYGVATTGIFCRPSCPSKLPKRENVRIFASPEEAKRQGFRPCKRCKPEGQEVPLQEWVGQIKAFLEGNFQQNMTLKELEEACHGSRFYLQRRFSEVVGCSPHRYLEQIRIDRAKESLLRGELPIFEVGRMVGFSNTEYFITRFRHLVGTTPLRYRRRKQRKEGS